MADGHLRLGLSLSGGGFRATLFHLGVVRLLRDAKLLKNVTHVCSVSGGSILGAHLVQHWEKYTSDAPSSPGKSDQFDETAHEIVKLAKYDLRGRITRRLFVSFLYRLIRRRAKSKLATDLLQKMYAKNIFRDKTLASLSGDEDSAQSYPSRPYLHILTTDLNTTGLCSFTNEGFSRDIDPSSQDLPELAPTHQTPLSLAVAASSAFPALFPPMAVDAVDLGIAQTKHWEASLSDGGVYDNLGVRKFQQLFEKELGPSYLYRDDITDLQSLREIKKKTDDNILPYMRLHSRLTRLAAEYLRSNGNPTAGEELIQKLTDEELIQQLNKILGHRDFYDEELWRSLPTEAVKEFQKKQYLPKSCQDQRVHRHHVVRVNRLALEAMFPDKIKKSYGTFDSVLISDATQPLKHLKKMHAGLLRTAVRAADVFQARVRDLQRENAESARASGDPRVSNGPNTRGKFHFIDIREIVENDVDPTAPVPDLQRRTKFIRTDLDVFSRREISALVRHGYCVARQALIRARFETDVPTGPPWDRT